MTIEISGTIRKRIELRRLRASHDRLLAAAKEARRIFVDHDLVEFGPSVVRQLGAAIAAAEELKP